MIQHRESAIRRVEKQLRRTASPRLQMMGIVSATAATGFLASYLMLKGGLYIMAVRYPLAVLFAYVVFLALVRLWLRSFRLEAKRRRSDSSIDLGDLNVSEGPWVDLFDSPATAPGGFGGGGGFSGGGASRVLDGPINNASAGGSSGGGHGGDWSLGDLDEGAVALIAVAAIAAVAFGVVLYVVWIAPALFAELLLDAMISAGLYKRLRGVPHHNWLATAVRRTALSALFVAALVATAGAIMQNVYPDARSIGPFVEHVRHPAPKP